MKKSGLVTLEQILATNEIRWWSEFGPLYPYKDGKEYHPGKNAGNAEPWGLE